MNLLPLKALGLVTLMFLGVYVPTFLIIGLIKPRPQMAIPLIIGLSLAIALTFIYFLSSRTRGFSHFGFEGSGCRYIWIAITLGVPVGFVLTFLASRYNSTNPFGDVSLPAVDDFSLFHHRHADSGRGHLPWTPPDDIGTAT
jgi:hypothetical protein